MKFYALIFTISKTQQNMFCHEICLSFFLPDCAILMLESSAWWWPFFWYWMGLVVQGRRMVVWSISEGPENLQNFICTMISRVHLGMHLILAIRLSLNQI